jgi:hypothetical protein
LSLIERGADGGVAGKDVCIIFKTGQTVDIRGFDNHQCTKIYIGTVVGDPNSVGTHYRYHASI